MTHDDEPRETGINELAHSEYELAVKTQMHFNEILMKFRSFGITAVVAVYSYALSRPPSDIITHIGLAPSQVIALAGMILTILFWLIDLGYFFPLLLGAVDRSLTLQDTTTYRLTSTITKHVSRRTARNFVKAFYATIVLTGAILAFAVLPASQVAAK